MFSQKALALASFGLLIALSGWQSFFSPAGPEIKDFFFSTFVDGQLNYTPNKGEFYDTEEMYFLLGVQGLEQRNGFVSYSVDAEIKQFSGSTIAGKRIIVETVRLSENWLTIVGVIDLYKSVEPGRHVLVVTLTDNYSGKKETVQKPFLVKEWPIEDVITV